MTTKHYLNNNVPSATGSNTSQHVGLDDGINLRGRVRCLVEDIDPITGAVVSQMVHDKSNLVVTLGKECLCYLLTAPQTNRYITTFRLGTKGNKTGDNLTPIKPLDDDVNLYDKDYFQKDFTGFHMYPADGVKNEVQFSCVLEPDEANGKDESVNEGAIAYTEAGMYTAAGTLFARETFPAVVKTKNRRITFTWSIMF